MGIANGCLGGYKLICEDCGVTLCFEISEEEYEQKKPFWDNWRCDDCRLPSGWHYEIVAPEMSNWGYVLYKDGIPQKKVVAWSSMRAATRAASIARERQIKLEQKDMITSFRNEYAFLSNFYPSPIVIMGETWPTVEHYFQAMKTLDPNERDEIRTASSPSEAKRLGKKVQLRQNWGAIKILVMRQALNKKFANPQLMRKLKATGTQQIIEGNTWGDKYWGCIYEDGKWAGENHLGKMLMTIRDTPIVPKQNYHKQIHDPYMLK